MKNGKVLQALLLVLLAMFVLAACEAEEPVVTTLGLNPGDEDCAHVFTEWEITKETSCTQMGKLERTCTECGREEEQTRPAIGHAYYGGVCSECGKEAKNCEHPETENVVVMEATCTEDGQGREVCKLCKAVVDYNYLPALHHPETEAVVISEATCTDNGETQYICKLCGEVADTEYEWALWHPEREVVVVTLPTCTEKGMSQEVCKTCGEVVDGWDVSALGHSYEYIDAEAPTCTEIGWYNYRHCTVCDYLYNYEERPATGHSYKADICATCSYVNPSFNKVTAPGITEHILPYASAEKVTYTAQDVRIDVHTGNISKKGQVDVYTLEVTVAGRHCIQMREVYSGKTFKLYLYNSLGEEVKSDTSCVNGDYIWANLSVGTYTVKVQQYSGYSTYELLFCYTKALSDVTQYDAITDKMDFPHQINTYSFTPAVTGRYSFTLSELTNNSEVYVAIADRLGEDLAAYSDKGNGSAFYVTLKAGETYKFRVYNQDDRVTPYTVTIGKQKEQTDLTGYTGAEGYLQSFGQVDYYTFTATSRTYFIQTTGNSASVKLYLYNHLGETVEYNNYCGNGEGISLTNLTVGETYKVAVYRGDYKVHYTLHLYAPKPAYAMTSDMAVTDSIEYSGQKNSYTFTATREGTHRVMLLIHSAGSSYMRVTIYDANGTYVSEDSYAYDGDYLILKNLQVGSQYTIVVTIYESTASYTLSIQE